MSIEVKVPAGLDFLGEPVPATSLVVREGGDGAVYWGGQIIGYVRKGHRTYSPPTHKGSRIVKYHKQVPEWHGWYGSEGAIGRPSVRRDSRRQVLRDLIGRSLRPRHG